MSNFCGGCGRPRPTPVGRFCPHCGAAFEAEAVAAAPAPGAPAAVPAPAASPAPSAGPDYAFPATVPRAPGEPGPRVRPGRIMAVGALVLALTVGGVVGWQLLGSSGGAASPEAAVQEFLEAAAAQDPVAALSVVNPGEVDGIDEVYEALHQRLADEDLIGGEGLTEALEVTLEDLAFDVDEQGEHAARVELTDGSYTVRYDPERVPERLSFIAEESPDPRTWSGDILDEIGYEFPDADLRNDQADPFLSTVEVDGGWYVTLLGTYADMVFLAVDTYEGGLRTPDYDVLDEEVEPVLAETPEGVLDDLADAVSDGDAEQLLASFPQDLVAGLRPYARTVEDALADEDVTIEVSVSELDAEAEELGDDLVRLTVDNLVVQIDTVIGDGSVEQVQLVIDGRCATYTDFDEYGYDEDSGCLDGDVADRTGIDEIVLVVREVDGGYQVDPLATAVAYADTVLDAAPSSLVDDAIDELADEF